ncbi:metallophosphoesterase family protein [Paenibacillus eucommiae]|uniref:Phosphoesterase n=1 Tax=Paenibacillus eucommiae TaxID=1355755 RepID=A0ABS4J629_9BACL|nr:metallophosphoesterase [Paenibacillus eucommiae]MBP1995285.1 putative phosphoesterase [Paenibacillus eucommiae]
MKIGVISDTHLTDKVIKLPDALVEGLTGVDLILHAGDWMSPRVIDLLERIAPCSGVAGNNDGQEIIERFGRKRLLTLDGYRIGIVHGDGYRQTTEERARASFLEERPDVVIFGHSHIPYVQLVDGILMFNPGSPTDKRKQPRFSYGILELNEQIHAQHVFYDNKA